MQIFLWTKQLVNYLFYFYCENESNPPLNQTLPLEKKLGIFVKQVLNTPINKQRKFDVNIFHLINFVTFSHP